jgi:hypothetical protein
MPHVQVATSEAEPRRKRRMRISPRAEAQVQIDADPKLVWEVVADVTRQDRWSCEATSCEWLPPAESAVLGARFRGRNRRGFRRWTRTNEITAFEPGRTLVWLTLPTWLYPDSTEWRVELQSKSAGTVVTESYRIIKLRRSLEVFLYWFNPTHRDRRGDLEQDLLRLKAFVESRR